MASRDYITHQLMNKAATKKSPVTGDDLALTELGKCVRSGVSNIGSTFITAANEPSQALYRIQEHVRKSVPALVEQRNASTDIGERLNGSIFDAEYAADAVNTANGSLQTFKSINDNLKTAVHLAQQIQHTRSQRPSMYASGK